MPKIKARSVTGSPPAEVGSMWEGVWVVPAPSPLLLLPGAEVFWGGVNQHESFPRCDRERSTVSFLHVPFPPINQCSHDNDNNDAL